MSKLLCIVSVLLCVGTIIAGNIHWKQKLSANAEMVIHTEGSAVSEENVMKKEVPPTEDEHKLQDPNVEEKENELYAYTRNLPKELQEKITKASSSGKPVHLVIYGSESTSNKKDGWPELLKNQLMAAYGEKVMKVTVISEGDMTSIDVIRAKTYEKVSKQKPDIVLFEPFTLKDNSGKISTNNRFSSIDKMIRSWQQANKAVTILLQPPNPIYGATYYPKQVNDLKEFAKKHSFLYLDHWGSWPNLNDKKMNDYLTQSSMPNEKGNKIWAEYLIDYFVAK